MYHSRYLRPAGQATVAPYCASLPSSDAAYRALAGGSPEAWGEVAGSTLLRGLLIAGGLALYDPHDPKLLRRGLAGAIGIEVFVLGWTWWKMSHSS